MSTLSSGCSCEMPKRPFELILRMNISRPGWRISRSDWRSWRRMPRGFPQTHRGSTCFGATSGDVNPDPKLITQEDRHAWEVGTVNGHFRCSQRIALLVVIRECCRYGPSPQQVSVD